MCMYVSARKVKEPSIEELSYLRTSFPDPSPMFERRALHKSTSSKQQLCLFLIFFSFLLPHPASPDIKPHEIYTAFKLNVDEGYISLGLHGMVVEIPQ